jgi:hypothetical protein
MLIIHRRALALAHRYVAAGHLAGAIRACRRAGLVVARPVRFGRRSWRRAVHAPAPFGKRGPGPVIGYLACR